MKSFFTKMTGLAACLAVAWTLALSPSSARAEELRIGLLVPLTGIFTQIGKDMRNGMLMYLEENNYNLAGAKIKLIIEDSQGKPPVNVRKANKLIRQDDVHMFIGGLLASTGYALAPVSTRNRVVYIPPIPAADDLTQRQKRKYPYVIRTGWTSSQPSHPFGKWACEQGYKRITTVAADYAFGHEVVGGFQRTFEACGGKIVQKLWPRLGSKDFGPFMPLIKRDVDAVFTLMVGPMSLAFPKQYKAAGHKAPLLGGGTSADEFILPFMGEEAIGYVTALQYSAALDTPKNVRFVKTYRSKYGKVPSYYSESLYTTTEFIHEAMKKTGGKWPGSKQFIKIMSGIKLNAVRGPVYLDKDLNPVHNIYIRQVTRMKLHGYPKAELWNKIIKTYKNVSQYGDIPRAQYLQTPLYHRDNYPGCPNCEN